MHSKRSIQLTSLLVLLFGISSFPMVRAESLSIKNLAPWQRIYGATSLDTDPSQSHSTGKLSINNYVANYYAKETGADGTVVSDGELWLSELYWQHPINSQITSRIRLNYASQSDGAFDSFIYKWHDLFGLPQGGRSENTANHLDVSITSPSGTVYAENQPYSGWGDLITELDYRLPVDQVKLNAQFAVKWPTEKHNRLIGSGSTDISAGLAVHSPHSDSNWSYWGGISITALGDGPAELADLQKSWLFSGRAGSAYALAPQLSAILQLDLQSGIYRHSSGQLGKETLMLTIGGRYRWQDYSIEFAVTEDPVIESAPDVMAMLSISRHY